MGDLREIPDKVEEQQEVPVGEHGKQDQGTSPASGGNGDQPLPSSFIRECLNANELGDAWLYAKINRGKFLYSANLDKWLCWGEHHWELDIMRRSLAAVDGVVALYLKEAQNISKELYESDGSLEKNEIKLLTKMRNAFHDRCRRLRSDKRCNTLKFVACNMDNQLAVKGDEFDQQARLLPCKNGIIDLVNGRIGNGRHEQYLLKACDVEYKGLTEPAPLWEKTLLEIFGNDVELYNYVQRLFGSALISANGDHVLPVLHGQGRNGKSLIVEMISHVLGELAGPIPANMLLDQFGVKNSAGPSPDIMSLRGLRIAFASETDENRRISPSQVKWLSGGDSLVGRNPHDKYLTKFTPTHTLFLITNHLPQAPASDFAFWERINIIPFKLSFIDRKPQADNERPADKKLMQKLKAESSGILSWLIRGCIAWQQQGLNPPAVVKEASKRYRRNEDMLADFLAECCDIDSASKSTSGDLYAVFSEWYKNNINKKEVMSHRRFGQIMMKRFERSDEPIGGYYYYYGVRPRLEQND